jgi:NIMA (never in mitosis gene a)-related kinase
MNTVIYLIFQYLHERRVLHRDIKTQNVFLTGPEKVAKLGDLGLAKYVIN